MNKLDVVLVGSNGYWGKILKRNIKACPSMRLAYEVDAGGEAELDSLSRALESFSLQFEAVVIATPPDTHFELAKQAIEAGKHVLLEKPMCTSAEDANELLRLAKEHKVKLCVDHTFLFSEHIRVIKDVISSGEIGEVVHVSSERLNLGKFQDSGVIWDLAPHDIALTNYLFDDAAVLESTVAHSHLGEVRDHAVLHMYYPKAEVSYTLTLSWLSPRKTRTTMIIGTKGMIEYDMLSDAPIVIYDKRAEKKEKAWSHHYSWKKSYDKQISEPLALLMKEFASHVLNDTEFISDGELGASVVGLIEETGE